MITPEHLQDCNQFLEHCKGDCHKDRRLLDESIVIWRNTALQNYILEMKPQLHLLPKASCTPEEAIPSIAPVNTNPNKLNSDNPAHHLLPSFARIMEAGYYPTVDDILSLRVPTTGK